MSSTTSDQFRTMSLIIFARVKSDEKLKKQYDDFSLSLGMENYVCADSSGTIFLEHFVEILILIGDFCIVQLKTIIVLVRERV